MHRRYNIGLLYLAILTVSFAPALLAVPDFFSDRCAQCHHDDSPTCDGCHAHHGPLSASTNQAEYAPGDIVGVTLQGGQAGGWIRSNLYDQTGTLVDHAAGPTWTGDDGQGSPVTFPVTLHAPAPQVPGQYTWEAAWFGGRSGGDGHLEDRFTISVIVAPDLAAVPNPEPVSSNTWGKIKAMYR